MVSTIKFATHTGILLWRHLSIHDIIEVFQPFLLIDFCLAGKQEASVGRYYGDAVLPGTIAMSSGRQTRGSAVTMVPVPQKHLTLGKGMLQKGIEDEEKEIHIYLNNY